MLSSSNKEEIMEKITFNIFKPSKTLYLIRSNDIRTCYKEIANGGCISDLETLIAEMRYITKEVMEKYGNEAVFQIGMKED